MFLLLLCEISADMEEEFCFVLVLFCSLEHLSVLFKSKSFAEVRSTEVAVLGIEVTDRFDLCLEALDDACDGVESRHSDARPRKLLLISIYSDEANRSVF